ncbi:PBSX family phage terminase large subunit [Streptomyces sp. LS1784]|uniref:PBSX family phage terminase large subunit n=1 Tax=Streptomyces sp. LS1784 TaxID=2851533 RepID=UPI001CC97B8F|nr:PBSX family phage terminase large subunit [Streptomyces sp. LS1784]
MLDQLPLSRKQLRSIAQATARINIWSGAIRSGKTIASLLAFLIAISTAPTAGLIVIVGRSLQTIERNVLDPLQTIELFGPLAHQVHHTRGATTATILGRTIHLIGASDARAEGRLRGLTASLAYVDEATLLPEGFWNQLLGRLSVPGARLFATTNPDSPAHWLKRKFLDRRAQLDLQAWHFTLNDNPSLAPAYVTALKSEYVGLWYRRMIDGAWVAAEGAVFDMWDPERHVVPAGRVPAMQRLLALGVDYGTTNPSTGLLLGLGVDRRLYLVDEWRHDPQQGHQRLTDGQLSASLRQWMADQRHTPEWVVVDPAAASFRVQLHQDGVTAQEADNDVSRGISLLATLLAQGQLLVSDHCQGFINEAPGYSWDPKATEEGKDKPIKVADHSLDGGRYAITTTEALWRPHLITPLEMAA